jgi:hypothetical protein
LQRTRLSDLGELLLSYSLGQIARRKFQILERSQGSSQQSEDLPRTVSLMTDFGNPASHEADTMNLKFGFVLKNKGLSTLIPEPR